MLVSPEGMFAAGPGGFDLSEMIDIDADGAWTRMHEQWNASFASMAASLSLEQVSAMRCVSVPACSNAHASAVAHDLT
jgi:hypothetical protein